MEVHQYGVFILGSVNFCETFRYLKFGETHRAKTWRSVLFFYHNSQLFPLDSFRIMFLLRDSENDLFWKVMGSTLAYFPSIFDLRRLLHLVKNINGLDYETIRFLHLQLCLLGNAEIKI